jgi:hypothetical protein
VGDHVGIPAAVRFDFASQHLHLYQGCSIGGVIFCCHMAHDYGIETVRGESLKCPFLGAVSLAVFMPMCLA